MINYKVIVRILGLLLLLEGAFLLLSSMVALLYGENDFAALIGTSGITVAIGSVALLSTRKALDNFGKREGYLIVTLAWTLFSAVGALPYVLSGHIPNYTDAFFEAISGFTTTGASVLTNIEGLPHGLLFWRSMTQWLGGMGMIVMSLAVLPMLGIGGMQLFVAEVPGPTPDKLHPRVRETAKRLWGIYLLFTVIQTVLLWFSEMNFFDALCHSLTTMATGGYSTQNTSMVNYSPYVQYIVILFMFIAGTNFTLSYFALKMKPGAIWRNEEFRYYTFFTLGATMVITLGLIFVQNEHTEKAFRDALFQVVSIVTTTGYVSADYELWPSFLLVIIFILMFFGGSAGSTGGGIKIVRITLLVKNSWLEFRRLMHPQAIIPVRLSGKAVQPQIVTNILAFIVTYVWIFLTGSLIISSFGYDLDSSMGAVAATLGNIGPGIGDVGPMDNFAHIPPLAKWILSFLMLIGRLELFTVLVLFSRAFWKK